MYVALQARTAILKDVRPLAFSMGSIERAFESAYARAVTRYVNRIKESTDGAAIVDAIRTGDAAALADATAWVEADREFNRDIERLLLEVVSSTGSQAAARIGVSFSLDNPYTVEWARQHAAELVTMIGDTTREAIRDYVAAAFDVGTTADDLARQLRDVVGITPSQAARLDTLRGMWLADGLTAGQVNQRIATLTERMVRDRSLLIARTEIITAANQGQLASWRIASDRGLMLPTTVKVWIAASGSDRTCPICSELDGKRAQLAGEFPGGRMAPPAHPACRCTMGLETLSPEAYAQAFGG